jgi:hypothetical protein
MCFCFAAKKSDHRQFRPENKPLSAPPASPTIVSVTVFDDVFLAMGLAIRPRRRARNPRTAVSAAFFPLYTYAE